jgi:ribonuclease HI
MNACPDAKEWIFHLLETTSHSDFTTILITLWEIQTARRKAIHESIFQSPVTIVGFVQKYELSIVNAKNLRSSSMIVWQTAPRWIPPPADSLKINVDGGIAKTQNKGAAAPACRDALGRYMGSSIIVVEGITDPATLEAMACNEALALAADLSLQRLQIASDAAEVLKNISTGSFCHYSTILREIESRQTEFSLVRFIHEGRASNHDAHNLVRSALFLEFGRHVWLLEPWTESAVPRMISE